MRKLIAVLLVTALLCAAVPGFATAAMSDNEVALTVAAAGIMTGDQNGDMKLDNNVTRAEFVKMMTVASVHKDTAHSGGALFADARNHWASGYIRTAADAGWVVGYTDGTFRPQNTITAEEAASALLKLLGYTVADLSGVYPDAQMNKFFALGLGDGLSLVLGQPLKRYECMYIFYNLLTAHTKQGNVYGTTLGYALDNEGKVDYRALLTKNMQGPFAALGAIDIPFEPREVYRDGRAAPLTDLVSFDVYYYNENVRTVWIYSDKVTGVCQSVSPNNVAPSAVTVGGKSYTLGTAAARGSLSSSGAFAVGDAVTLLLGMNGEVVEVLDGHDDIDYWEYATAGIDGPHINTGGLDLVVPFDTANAIVYRDNKLSNTAAIESLDVIYYNENVRTIWAYSDKVTGVYAAAMPNVVSPDSISVGGKSYALGSGAVRTMMSSAGMFVPGDAVTLLLGMNGEVVDVLSGQRDIDYWEYATAGIEGPFVNVGGLDTIVPFALDGADVYRDNKASDAHADKYDVVYYNTRTNTVWIYTSRAIGIYTAASPSVVSPTSVTVGGNVYALGTATARSKVSATGSFAVGDTVALLLGMDGTAVDVVEASEVEGAYYGVVREHKHIKNDEYKLTVFCTDGITRTAQVSESSYKVGGVVSLTYSRGELTVKRPAAGNLSGFVSADARTLGDLAISEHVSIIDTTADGRAVTVQPSRLAGVTIKQGGVVHYAQNERGEITHLILRDVTGDTYDYGIVTSVSEVEGAMLSRNGTYGYIIDGAAGVARTTTKFLGAVKGVAQFDFESGEIQRITALKAATIDQLFYTSAQCGDRRIALADDIAVYIKSKDSYTAVKSNEVDNEQYKLTGYFDENFVAGGRIRVIIAELKG